MGEEGAAVQPGQVRAGRDGYAGEEAMGARLEAELGNDEAEYGRNEDLYKKNFVSVSERDAWKTRVEVARANDVGP